MGDSLTDKGWREFMESVFQLDYTSLPLFISGKLAWPLREWYQDGSFMQIVCNNAIELGLRPYFDVQTVVPATMCGCKIQVWTDIQT